MATLHGRPDYVVVSGIFRDVYLLAMPKVQIRDVQLRD